ncbi:xanthine dehydrogenase accessory protein XdhC [Thiolinea disciformis]|uniref:xanthine dehydrogenase accessory protein XdhC n=1 Tax=Thiolinea disciformis TaxID=125614 RepID=UPI00036A82B0|nr:xanthine dehydrogenase accessory protein XdhC [Thiolinea disciformis]
MFDWQTALQQHSANQAILVTVLSVKGSAPREVGARMLVTTQAIFDTIGGGQLEYQAIQRARATLNQTDAPQYFQTSYALGADCQQCCGGVVTLHFERLTLPVLTDWQPLCLPELVKPIDWHIAVFGAGHVGQAVVSLLASLPCSITWIDNRPEQFPAISKPAIKTIFHPSPPAYVADLPADCYFLIMTHDHALDLDLCDHVLARDEFAFLGLIGSASKAAKFKHRLRERGLSAIQLQRLVCPVGISGIRHKQPAAIAVSVVAQLLQIRSQH